MTFTAEDHTWQVRNNEVRINKMHMIEEMCISIIKKRIAWFTEIQVCWKFFSFWHTRNSLSKINQKEKPPNFYENLVIPS